MSVYCSSIGDVLVLKAVVHSANYIEPQDFTDTLMNLLSVMKLLLDNAFLGYVLCKEGKTKLGQIKKQTEMNRMN